MTEISATADNPHITLSPGNIGETPFSISTLMKRLEAATSRLEDLSVWQSRALSAKYKSSGGEPNGNSVDIDSNTTGTTNKNNSNINNPNNNNTNTNTNTTNTNTGNTNKNKNIITSNIIEGNSSSDEKVSNPHIVVPWLSEWDNITIKYVIPFVNLSKEIDENSIGKQADLVAKAFKQERDLLEAVAFSRPPSSSSEEFVQLLTPLSNTLAQINNINQDFRKSKYSHLLSAVEAGISALGWVSIKDTPTSFIEEMKNSAQFYTNRALKDLKDTQPKVSEWVNLFISILNNLKSYVKINHTTGPSWNKKSSYSLKDYLALKSSKDSSIEAFNKAAAKDSSTSGFASNSSSAASTTTSKSNTTSTPVNAAGGPPPPPPPPSTSFLLNNNDSNDTSASSKGTGINAVFAEINKGESVTAGLRKVPKSEMTHKNPSLRASTSISTSDQQQTNRKPTPPLAPKPASLSIKNKNVKPVKAPSKTLEDKRWYVEHFIGNHDIVVDASIDQAVFISNLKDCTVTIKGKCNAVTLNASESVGILLESTVSGVDVIKCNKIGIQITGLVPFVSIDQSHESKIYLSKEYANTEVYTSQSTSLNVYYPEKTPSGDEFIELAIPEQLKHTIKNGKLVSTIVEHAASG